jgi:hypothetical protein
VLVPEDEDTATITAMIPEDQEHHAEDQAG